jgi:hypothetical protein
VLLPLTLLPELLPLERLLPELLPPVLPLDLLEEPVLYERDPELLPDVVLVPVLVFEGDVEYVLLGLLVDGEVVYVFEGVLVGVVLTL